MTFIMVKSSSKNKQTKKKHKQETEKLHPCATDRTLKTKRAILLFCSYVD